MRPISWKTYASAFVISVFIFGTGVLLGTMASQELTKSLANEIIDVRTRTTELELLSLIDAGNNSCMIYDKQLTDFDEQTAIIDRRVDIIESQPDKLATEDVQRLKREFTIMQIRDFLLTLKINSECNTKLNTILFFYTNKNCPDCTKQGLIGPEIKKDSPTTRIYALDVDLKSPAVELLKSKYGVQQFPSLVINGKTFQGLTSKEDVQKNLN